MISSQADTSQATLPFIWTISFLSMKFSLLKTLFMHFKSSSRTILLQSSSWVLNKLIDFSSFNCFSNSSKLSLAASSPREVMIVFLAFSSFVFLSESFYKLSSSIFMSLTGSKRGSFPLKLWIAYLFVKRKYVLMGRSIIMKENNLILQ